MTFYASALSTTVDIMNGSSGPGMAETDKDRVLHARLEKDGAQIMASDTMSMTPFQLSPGNNFSISIACDDAEEQDRYFNALKEGGQITMPLQDTFWGARFGMLVDKFGIQWMFNFDK